MFSRLNFGVPEDLLQGAATGKQGVIEFILYTLRSKVTVVVHVVVLMKMLFFLNVDRTSSAGESS